MTRLALQLRVMECAARPATTAQIVPWRDLYRQEMSCQIIHDSIHFREGWTREYLLMDGPTTVGYGSVAVAGPWAGKPTVYEFHVTPPARGRVFDLFEALLAASGAVAIETQSNDPSLTVMLHAVASGVVSESILFHDRLTTHHPPPEEVVLRRATPDDAARIAERGLDSQATWVLEQAGGIAATGGVLFHYNRPYGDLYMAVAEPLRRRGLGSYLVQELKRITYEAGNVPAARCNSTNIASRRTLQKSGFVPCGHILVGTLAPRADAPCGLG